MVDRVDEAALDEVGIGVQVDGVEHRHMPDRFSDLEKATPVYAELPGWREDLSGVTEVDQLPPRALSYVKFLETEIGVPIRLVCVGPGREQYLRLTDS